MDKLALKDIFARMWKQKEEEGHTEGPARTGAGLVLIVDDSRTVVRALQLMLERDGYVTLSGFDGQEAVALAKRHRPDLIVMDVVMPRMNGFEATRAILNDPETKSIPVMLMSGIEQPGDERWGIRLGAKAFLAKPFKKEDFLAKVRAVIALAQRTEALAAQAMSFDVEKV
jgi:twitching motility two-component system response regulator PilH